jgi:precorrin-2 dehydrogenase/sirohydrochlorin ferrochelatase
MGWTPLFLKMDSKKVLIVGAGEVGERRAKRFLEAGADVVIIGKDVSTDLVGHGASIKPLNEVEKWVEWSDIVVAATSDHSLNQRIADLADEKLLNRADYPQKGNLIVPSSFFLGDVQICIFTKGKSPLMAKELRKRIQKIIKEEDILKLELQNFTRNILKEKIKDQKKRRSFLYKILDDENIERYLKNGDMESAKGYIEESIQKF